MNEQEIRILRDKVYEIPITDKSWEDCKAHWINDVEWLKLKTATL